MVLKFRLVMAKYIKTLINWFDTAVSNYIIKLNIKFLI